MMVVTTKVFSSSEFMEIVIPITEKRSPKVYNGHFVVSETLKTALGKAIEEPKVLKRDESP